MKRIFKILAGFIAVLGLAFLIYIVSSKQEEVNVSDIIVSISYPEEDIFIEEAEVKSLIIGVYKNIFLENINQISTDTLESLIKQNPYVRSANVYSSIQGELMIDVEQRQPIFRVEMAKASFYVDNFGGFMPLSPEYASRLVVVSGHLKNIDFKKEKEIHLGEESENTELASVFHLVKYIRVNPFMEALVEQIYVNKNHEIELIPKLGKQYILFGEANQIEEKFSKLKLFYEQGMQVNGWNAYKILNLKYKNQIVCTKI
jgi:cell division protein FtsQ